MAADRAPNQHLILSPVEWRDLLRDELLWRGVERDAAGVIARCVIERLVRRYLGQEIPLDRAA